MEQKPEIDLSRDPFDTFDDWYAEAEPLELNDPNAVALATADASGCPSVRMVLLKEWDKRGFVIYTNWNSRKGKEFQENQRAALCLYWKSTKRQIRIVGPTEQVSQAESDAYYDSRYLGSRIGAIASQQSQPLESREKLMAEVAELEKVHSEDNPPKRPENWAGLRIIPTEIEFWQEQPFRLHDRWVFTRKDAGADWSVQRLYP
ncbi:MAG: pyridoxamine 5'-phosphate oxidase [Alphaproteobacteria bacterium]